MTHPDTNPLAVIEQLVGALDALSTLRGACAAAGWLTSPEHVSHMDDSRAALTSGRAALAAVDAKLAEAGARETEGEVYMRGFDRGLEASASYKDEARAYKEAYLKLAESVASMKAFDPPPPIIITSNQQAALLEAQPAQPLELSDERCEAEREYSTTAHNYPENHIGSRDWALYWAGWLARSTCKFELATANKKAGGV